MLIDIEYFISLLMKNIIRPVIVKEHQVWRKELHH